MSAKPVSLRLEEDTIQRLRAVARRTGVGWQTLVKIILTSKLAELENASEIILPEGVRRRKYEPQPEPKDPESGDPVPEDEASPPPTDMTQEEIDRMFSQLG